VEPPLESSLFCLRSRRLAGEEGPREAFDLVQVVDSGFALPPGLNGTLLR
jgi:hypothetical protein